MNTMTKAVLKYKETKSEEDFAPIYNHFEPKIKYMARQRALRLPICFEDIYEAMIDGLLLAIKNYNHKKSEFSTYLYIWVNGQVSHIMTKINRPKHRGGLFNLPLYTTDEHGNELEIILPVASKEPNPEEQYLLNSLIK